MSMPIYTFTDSSSGSPKAANGGTLTANAQDDPVETTLKYIYVIRNKINDKVYVGQSKDPQRRFSEHIADSRQSGSSISAISGAMRKYGVENFYYEIVEGPTEDYNNREKYWIQFFNSISPNGYNEDTSCSKKKNGPGVSDEIIKEIENEIVNTTLSFREISRRHNVALNYVQMINMGKWRGAHGTQRKRPLRPYSKKKS